MDIQLDILKFESGKQVKSENDKHFKLQCRLNNMSRCLKFTFLSGSWNILK